MAPLWCREHGVLDGQGCCVMSSSPLKPAPAPLPLAGTTDARVERGPGWELHLGDYRDVLRGFDCDLALFDTPYSAKTHAGHDSGAARANAKQAATHVRPSDGLEVPTRKRRKLGYAPWDPSDVRECVDFFAGGTRGWMVSLTDDELEPAWETAMAAHDRYVFEFPTPWFSPGSRVRMSGDGPACWTCPIVQSRPRTGEDRNGRPYALWGALPGGYVYSSDRGVHGGNEGVVVGAKPLALMRALVRDYSRKGDVVLDPCAGGGTTLLAAVIEGRYAVGAEQDERTFSLAVARLRQGHTRVFDWHRASA